MRHRGPDDSGIFIDHSDGISVGLSSVRLAVVVPTPAGHQPFLYDNERYALSYNGEIYNFRELRRELRTEGLQFHTDTDTEVVAAACARWGHKAPARFNGMFAFAFYDRTTHNGFLARDRFGIKPLLYTNQRGQCCFASEMKTLHCLPDWDRSINKDSLLNYLCFGYFATPQSIYQTVSRLSPGCYISFDERGLDNQSSYVNSISLNTKQEGSYDQACGKVRKLLFKAVSRRRIADVPLGAFLSGGLDSSIIATHLAECTPGPIKTFSIGFTGYKTYDETSYARIMAKQCKSRHYQLDVTYKDVLNTVEPILEHQEEPFFDSSILPTALVSRIAREHVTVCLSGDGSDELFGGYWRYLGHNSIDSYNRIPAWIRHGILEPIVMRSPSSKSGSLSNRFRQFQKLIRTSMESCAQRHLSWSRILAPQAESILLDPERISELCAELSKSIEETNRGRQTDDALNRILAFDLRRGLPSDMLHKVDLASMYHSLEVRVPFLDPEVVEFAESCPSQFKVYRGMRKRLLTDAYRGIIPDCILDRSKMGFEVPIGEFLRKDMRDLFLSTVTRKRIESLELLDYDAVIRIYKDHCDKRAEHADLLFALLSLCWWHKRNQ